MEKEKRFIIISTGRSGSSLLAAILANAGANFGMTQITEWERTSGAYESPQFGMALSWFSRYRKLNIIGGMVPFRQMRQFSLFKMRRSLENFWKKADFAKATGVVNIVAETEKLGYTPKIIISFRRFEDFAISMHRKSLMSMKELCDYYFDVNATAITQLFLFGGCAIEYDDLVNKEEDNWAVALAHITDLDKSVILVSRDEIVKTPSNPKSFPVLDKKVFSVYETLKKIKNQVIPGER